ncbi:hypothetical protein GCM10009624_11150 [Gordonia sinesedis]
MTDNRHRNRHREHSDQPTEGIDLERLRYFTQPSDGKPSTRHRRRRNGPPSGQIPGLPLTGDRDDAPVGDRRAAPRRIPPADPGRPQRAGRRAAPEFTGPADTPPPSTMRSRAAARPDIDDEPVGPPVAGPSARTPQAPIPHRAEPRRVEPQRVEPQRAEPAESRYAEPRYAERRYTEPRYAEPQYPERQRRSAGEVAAASRAPVDPDIDSRRDYSDSDYYTDSDSSSGGGSYSDGGYRGTARADDWAADPTYVAPAYDASDNPAYDAPAYDDPDHRDPDDDEPDPDVDTRDTRRRRTGRGRRRPARAQANRASRGPVRPEALRRRRRRRIALAVVMACMLVLVAGVGYFGARTAGLLESSKDYTNTAGSADVIVNIPQNSTLKDFGQILVDNDVVGSVKAFTDAAGGRAMSGGYFKMRTQIPASVAVQMISDDQQHRVGRMVVPEGLQLDSKKGIDGKTTPGIFEMISDATTVSVNGDQIGVSVDQLEKAAADASPEELGVPDWARDTVVKLSGDHRRIEGLIAPGTWESIDPRQSAIQILRGLITDSAVRLQQWGLLDQNSSGLSAYQTLVSASVVEREVDQPADYAKVARVILNRLDKNQRLEMDSTANYTADVTNIDLSGESYKSENLWNTYQQRGLPVTPIGAVGERALEATENPATGNWLYFVTVDRNGTTLFADTFEQHVANRQQACDNKLLTTGCS